MKTDTRNHVLIVEDDHALNDAFTIVFEHAGFDVGSVYNGKEALEYLQKNTPDVIILDILMPIMDGRELLKNFDNKKKIPILALSNLDARSDIEHIIKLGATKYELKASTSPPELIQSVQQLIAK